ncbi:MAG TPA: hypothetical protein VLU54_02230 [Casimicrobiaceae bacterium]|nr:hypothetical protein [Casimicrobiaceae bacterium]
MTEPSPVVAQDLGQWRREDAWLEDIADHHDHGDGDGDPQHQRDQSSDCVCPELARQAEHLGQEIEADDAEKHARGEAEDEMHPATEPEPKQTASEGRQERCP